MDELCTAKKKQKKNSLSLKYCSHLPLQYVQLSSQLFTLLRGLLWGISVYHVQPETFITQVCQ